MKVKIKLEETVVYYQEIEISKQQYNEIKDFDGKDLCCNEQGYHEVLDYIDNQEIFDTTGEIRNLEIEVV